MFTTVVGYSLPMADQITGQGTPAETVYYSRTGRVRTILAAARLEILGIGLNLRRVLGLKNTGIGVVADDIIRRQASAANTRYEFQRIRTPRA